MENLALVCQAKRASELEKELEALSEQLAWFRRYFLHRKADVVEDSSQQALAFDETEQIHEEKEDTEELEESEEIRSYKRRKPKRQPLPEDLPRVLEIIDIDEEEKICGCGHELIRIGEEKSEKLDMEPPRLRVIEQIRPKYACRACEGSGDEEKPAVRIAPVLIDADTRRHRHRRAGGIRGHGEVRRRTTAVPPGEAIRAYWGGALATNNGRLDDRRSGGLQAGYGGVAADVAKWTGDAD